MCHLTQNGAATMAIATVLGACSGEQSRSAEMDTASTDSTVLAATAGAEPRVSSVMIGKRIGTGNRITEPSFEFAPRDTVHVSIGVEGFGDSDSLTAAWRYQTGEIIEQSARAVRPPGENTTFDLSRPKGLKPGTYKVVLFLSGDSVDTKVFVVRK